MIPAFFVFRGQQPVAVGDSHRAVVLACDRLNRQLPIRARRSHPFYVVGTVPTGATPSGFAHLLDQFREVFK
jgi:hypothetical protein